ncbi:MAG: Galactokinase [Actinomycetota bacterium]|nr:Galactokinase [Actinomycetota bacterium]
MRDLGATRSAFVDAFGPGDGVRTFFAPGRVNLIGDHIDYSGGLVMPIALDRGTLLLARPRTDTALRGVSLDREGMVTADVRDTAFDPAHDWFSYVLGVLHVLGEDGYTLKHGLDILIAGDIPDGAGLSSSASLELAAAVAFDTIGGFGLAATDLALIGQRTENDYIGVSCGIMDQLAVARGRAGHALLMDCADLIVEYVPFPHDQLSLIIANSNHRRSLADSAYNDRRQAVESAAEVMGTTVLVHASLASVEAARSRLNEQEFRRARHTVTEQARVVAAAAALRSGDFAELGALMRASHESLRDDFDVTGPQLDALAEAAWAQSGVIGARMTGAGFGGCAVVLAEPGREDEVIAGIDAAYFPVTGLHADCFVVGSDDGARELLDGASG